MCLVGQDGGKGDARVVVDGHVQILVAGASRLPGTVAVDAVARLDDARQPLDIEVNQVAGDACVHSGSRAGAGRANAGG